MGPNFENRIQVRQGEHAVSKEKETCLTAILGSCVATALWDDRAACGGMNHILLPSEVSVPERPGLSNSLSAEMAEHINSMEVLINAVLRLGARKSDLKAKVFGGSEMIQGLSSAGRKNIDFVKTFLGHEGIPIVNESTGGETGRTIEFWTATGRARQRMLSESQNDRLSSLRSLKMPGAARSDAKGTQTDLELF